MDYKDLADLIFPDAKPVEYYEEKYPERNLKEGAIVTRVAPSPTGSTHIGTLYQALIARTVARQSDGVFFVRIEDTDTKREVEGGIDNITGSLNYFGLGPDEGMVSGTEEKGYYGPYKQSLRKEIYQSFAKKLISEGKAYPCFCNEEELNKDREKQEKAKMRPGYYGEWARCRKVTVEDAINKIKAGESYVIRFKSPGNENRKIQVSDVIKGKVTFPENDLDIVIIKSDGLPTYHFAHCVDDHLMRTTHVIRGDEWLSSLPLHIQLFKVSGYKPPKYCHIAPIMKNDNGNKRKLSKRKDPEAGVSYFAEIGVLPEAVKEYLLNIANSTFENWRRANKDKSIEEFPFQLNKMSVSGALFDFTKLFDVSKNVISRLTAEEVYNYSNEWAQKYDNDLAKLLEDKEYSLKVFGIERNNSNKPRKDLSKWSDVKDNIIYMYEAPTEFDYDKITGEDAKRVINEYAKTFDISDDKQTWFEKMKDVAEKCGYAREVKEFKQNPDKWPGHVGYVSTVIRVTLTGRRNTPDLYEIIQVLGKDEVEKRLVK
ncbi:MAG: glutamate--tRNA ligase [Clostridia bacterium]|nr:glutamate--tRNA ligase [Clostridia bacterium]